MKFGNIDIIWLGHSGFKIKGSKLIYIDPFRTGEQEKADIILVTHEHYDHCSIEDVVKLVKQDTVVIATPGCQSKLIPERTGLKKLGLAVPGRTFEAFGIRIDAVPSYNPKKKFHPKENENVGYIIKTAGTTIYHAGDTDLIPEMSIIKGIDIALLPVGGTYTMTAKEAAEAAQLIKPKVAIPMHYGSIVGSSADADTFKRLLEGKVRVEVL